MMKKAFASVPRVTEEKGEKKIENDYFHRQSFQSLADKGAAALLLLLFLFCASS